MDMSKAQVPAILETELIVWAAIHGCLCLALRHPEYVGASRAMVENALTGIEALLVSGGLFTREEMAAAHKVEQDARPPPPGPHSTVSVQVMSPDTPLRELLQYMLDRHIAHAEMPYSDAMFVHIALMFDRVESSKLSAHLDKVTLAAIHKANEKLRPHSGQGDDV